MMKQLYAIIIVSLACAICYFYVAAAIRTITLAEGLLQTIYGIRYEKLIPYLSYKVIIDLLTILLAVGLPVAIIYVRNKQVEPSALDDHLLSSGKKITKGL